MISLSDCMINTSSASGNLYYCDAVPICPLVCIFELSCSTTLVNHCYLITFQLILQSSGHTWWYICPRTSSGKHFYLIIFLCYIFVELGHMFLISSICSLQKIMQGKALFDLKRYSHLEHYRFLKQTINSRSLNLFTRLFICS